MKKILILGIKGMAGHLIYNYLPSLGDYSVYGVARNIESTDRIFNLDISNVVELQKLIEVGNYYAIINCIGILNKDAEDNPEKAIWFNSYFPHLLEKLTKKIPTQVIHISTDCVFSGKKGGYSEQDFRDGIGFYAQSKSLGEIDNCKDLTIRTSIVGPELNENGIGLFNWFMKQPKDAVIKGFAKAYWSGITTVELTRVIHDCIENNVVGVKEISRNEKISKFNMLNLFNEIFKSGEQKIVEDNNYFVDKSMISYRVDYIYTVPTYKQMFVDMKNWVDTHNLYQYK